MTQQPNIVRSSEDFVKAKLPSDTNRSTVFLACPGSYKGHCRFQQRMWSCEKCHRTLQCAHDGFFYCACGKAPVESCKFKCNSPKHGESFEVFENITESLKTMKSVKEVNILIIGETGVGKSTWVNAFCNYVSYATFERAEKGSIVYAIPSWLDIPDKGGKKKKVFIGAEEEKEEWNTKTGESVTQTAMSYVFKYRDFAIRLIDTPGIGDTRGLEADMENLQNILDHLSHYDQLHGICILVNANQTRLTNHFRFCISELLRQLHRDACRNIVFVFTHTRGSDYSPGTAQPILQEVLDQLKLPINTEDEKTTYCIDDEAVLAIYGIKNGLEVTDRSRRARIDSWDQSVRETGRMIKHFIDIEPHKLKNTLSLNETRRMILTLRSGPLANVTSMIGRNIKQLEIRQQTLRSSRGQPQHLGHDSGESLQLLSIVNRPLKKPRLVCLSEKCQHSSRNQNKEPQAENDKTQICCDGCRALSVRLCDVIRLLGGKCKMCECSWKCHKFQNYETVAVLKPAEEAAKKTENPQKVAGRSRQASFEVKMSDLESILSNYESELNTVADIGKKLAYFLQKNSIVCHNPALNEYAEMELHEGSMKGEKRKAIILIKEDAERDRDSLEALSLQEQFDTTVGDLPQTPQEVDELFKKLYDLKLNGRQLQEAMDVASASADALVYHGDKIFMPDLLTQSKRNSLQMILYDTGIKETWL